MEKTFDELVDLKAIAQVGTPTDLTKDELIERGYITDVTVASDLEITDEVVPNETEVVEPVVDEPEVEPEDEPATEPEVEPEVEPVTDEPVVDEGEEE